MPEPKHPLPERFYCYMDKSDWGNGPWQDEPDKIQWIDEATDLDCLIVRNQFGALCGYVGVPPEHQLHGHDYNDVDVEVHGGLTFADRCDEGAAEAEGICHVPAPGRPADVWWFGFDCHHIMDLGPGLAARERDMLPSLAEPRGQSYKPVAYVRAEVAALASQLAGV